MYSPKISEELVPVLYRLARDRRMPMTRLVNGLLREALASDQLPQDKPTPCLQAGNEEQDAELRPAMSA